jgi:hypothetical protein
VIHVLSKTDCPFAQFRGFTRYEPSGENFCRDYVVGSENIVCQTSTLNKPSLLTHVFGVSGTDVLVVDTVGNLNNINWDRKTKYRSAA